MPDCTPMTRAEVENRLACDTWHEECVRGSRYTLALMELRDTLLRVERMQAVVGAAVAWRAAAEGGPAEAYVTLALVRTVDAYLAGEKA